MKRWLIPFTLSALILGGTAYLLLISLPSAIDRGKAKRSLADARSITHAVESYRADHGHYPITFEIQALRGALEPNYIKIAPSWVTSYYSDGDNYALVVRPYADSGPLRYAAIEVHNGSLLAWPEELFDDEHIAWAKETLAETKLETDAALEAE
jgi:hypothetical protein